jgi:hypothetical protein
VGCAIQFGWAPVAAAQGWEPGAGQATAQAGGGEDIEQGAVRPSTVELHAGSTPAARPSAGTYHRDAASGTRLGLQLRVDALNMLGIAEPQGISPGTGIALMEHLFVPVATPGVRFLDARLFLGLGLGFSGESQSARNGPNSDSRSGFSLSPLVSYDVLVDDIAALSLLGWFNLASLGETERCRGNGCVNQNDDVFGVGLNLGAGLRGLLSPGLSLGGEFGWGFLSISEDPATDAFVHGIFGTISLEASIGI